MSAPRIPNLLSSRGARTAGRGRGRDVLGANATGERSAADISAQKDRIVQLTDQDANISRLSAVEAGYLRDPFAKLFAPQGDAPRRFPIINRGTYARTTGMDRLVTSFLASTPSLKQIISLGGGTDTRFFRLVSNNPTVDLIYHEYDFPINTSQKIKIIGSSPLLRGCLGDEVPIRWTEEELHSPRYHIHALDLRHLDPALPSSSHANVKLQHVDPSLPTLILSECCLTYLSPLTADAIVSHFVHSALAPSTPVGLALYEPINPHDTFGKVMVSNLAARGIHLQTLERYDSLNAQKERLKEYGFKDGVGAVNISFLMKAWIPEEEQVRVSKVEMLDEIEELGLLAKHYCIAWGWRDEGVAGDRANAKRDSVWKNWKLLESQPDDC